MFEIYWYSVEWQYLFVNIVCVMVLFPLAALQILSSSIYSSMCLPRMSSMFCCESFALAPFELICLIFVLSALTMSNCMSIWCVLFHCCSYVDSGCIASDSFHRCSTFNALIAHTSNVSIVQRIFQTTIQLLAHLALLYRSRCHRMTQNPTVISISRDNRITGFLS